VGALRGLPPAATLDVACGTAFLTRHLEGMVVGLDQSPAMVAVAASRLPDKRVSFLVMRCISRSQGTALNGP